MVSDKKKQLVQQLTQRIKDSPIVGLVNMQSLPAQQSQDMRAMLRDKGVFITMARKKLLKLAIENSGKDNIKNLIEKIKGMPALIFSNDNPFTLYSTLQKNKSEAPAKAGQEAPKDIVVKAGGTNFAPGPIISELAAVGIKTKVDGGKLAIMDDTIVAKEGDIISAPLAETLKRLDIKPMEVGLDLVAVWEDGIIYDGKQLHIDEDEYVAQFMQAASWAMNLAVETAFPTKETTEILLQKAFREAKALSIEANVLNDVSRDEILAKAERQALSVKDVAGVETVAREVSNEEESTPVSEVPAEESKEEETVEEQETPKEESKEAETPEEPAPETPAEPEQSPEETPELNDDEKDVEEKPVEESKPEENEESTKEPKEPETSEPVEETPTEEPKEEETVEEPASEPETPIEEPNTPESIPEEEKNEEPVSEPVEETPSEESKEEETVEEPKGASDMPSAADLIQAAKDRFSEKENKPVEPKVTAESLVAEEMVRAEQEKTVKPKKDKDVAETEELFEKLKKEGTLR